MLSLYHEPKVITFDCYGTLVRWHEVFLQEIGAVLAEHSHSDGDKAAAIVDSFSAQSRR